MNLSSFSVYGFIIRGTVIQVGGPSTYVGNPRGKDLKRKSRQKDRSRKIIIDLKSHAVGNNLTTVSPNVPTGAHLYGVLISAGTYYHRNSCHIQQVCEKSEPV